MTDFYFRDVSDRTYWENFLDRLPSARGLIWPAHETLRSDSHVAVISASLYIDAGMKILSEMEMGRGVNEVVVLASLADELPPLAGLLHGGLRHLVLCSPEGRGNEWLGERLSVLGQGVSWEPAASLHADAVVHEVTINTSRDKDDVITRIEGLISGSCPNTSFFRDRAALLADELLENALYAAPRASCGNSLFSKGEDRAVSPEERVGLRFGFDGKTLAIEVTDGWGTLTPEELLHHLARNPDREEMLEEPGGRGLFIVWRLMDVFYVCVEPGRCSRLGGHITIERKPEDLLLEKPLIVSARYSHHAIGK